MPRVSKRLAMLCLAALVLGSCVAKSQDVSESEMRELYYWNHALGDTSTFSAFVGATRKGEASDSTVQATWRFMRARFSATLGGLGYGTGPFTWQYADREKSALSQFQHDLGLRETGSLDGPTIGMLVKADSALSLTDVTLPNFGFYQEGGFVSAQGTWKATTNALGYPVNTADVECNATTGVCEVVSVEFLNDQLNQLGRIRRNTYKITHWSATDILATGDDWPGSDCHATLSVSIPTKEVVVHQWCTTGSTWPSGVKTGPSEMTLKLVDGSQLSPPFSGGDLGELHDRLYGERVRFLALREKNMKLGSSTR